MTGDEHRPDRWEALGVDPGCCAGCEHPKLNVTRRGTTYLRCLRAEWDPQLPRYPRLPVEECPGFEPRAPLVEVPRR